MDDLTTVTGCINARNYSQAIAVAGVTMPGNQDIICALTVCQYVQSRQEAADKVALAIADGN